METFLGICAILIIIGAFCNAWTASFSKDPVAKAKALEANKNMSYWWYNSGE